MEKIKRVYSGAGNHECKGTDKTSEFSAGNHECKGKDKTSEFRCRKP